MMNNVEKVDWQYQRPCTWTATFPDSKEDYSRINNIRLELIAGELFRVTGNGFVQFECQGLENAKTKAGMIIGFISKGKAL
ncbi:hypothetical protein GCM10009122_22620 [Fulvivirga kasyanovii]|uniref:Uncharacterized protein n=1 Tax=Fulvivirga kasyanovii TaxID=396812 RepID=A0ABW9RPS4_9BACT|nr:hypothetical protein [Fulvivirga kasyanovii]MTI25752.1 hypothetical protein [Fulvivirga kasyanovii]